MTHAQQTSNFDNSISAAIYDEAEGSREDLDHYAAIVEELAAGSVIDIGCGTGTLAIMLADRGHVVTGVDPAGAMLDVARAKPGAKKVRWLLGTAEVLPAAPSADLAVMTGNVAQVFLTDEEWLGTLRAIYDALGPLGYLVFETRIPERRAWEEWSEWGSSTYHVEGIGTVRDIFEVVHVQEPYVTIRSDNTLPDGSIVPNESTLIFRSMPELETTLAAAGFTIREVRDAPDRPGREWVVIAQRS
ncbi:SAM-dependent methyltransferase [Brachybacterium endophyticum]|uniref:SAM-dependent methyltransferase n=1 Tax=Brachybacterium endophyticum TaxID=2182385 RepID=A0A2U2RPS6_9MICO|nr:class I SAM-dependent methyltransferase [Brachybacterium endophyticum]PWH07872.1 SAM-dependent methyltransferase [Brachybacterium endophyticum]